VVGVVVDVVAAAAAVELVVVVVAIAAVTNPCQASTGSWVARRLKIPYFLTIST
jgi:hypothetical protein